MDRSTNLCEWWADCLSGDIDRCRGHGPWTADHMLRLKVYDNDGGQYDSCLQGCFPSSPPLPTTYLFLEAQRYTLAGNADLALNDPGFKGGWIDIRFAGLPATGQAWVGVQHSAPGQFVSVGHAATVLSKPIECVPALFTPTAEPATR